ncbi:DUF397 domain-containing protein [Streptomyces sp. P1-3]|uniref:DUF397 domain-containing protein n=1 Tax=Streptomyces sp. P1-3 TaxID=3421658 RepID=UPI003D35FF7C
MSNQTGRATPQVDLNGAVWRKSTRSAQNGACVEVAFVEGAVAMRDSKNPGGSVLLFWPDEWDAFLDGAQGGEFNRP